MNLRDIDIRIAALLGHYRLCNPKGERALYQTDINRLGGSMAMAVFEKEIKPELQWTIPDNSFEQPERRWWQSEINSDMWYTGAVPQYTTNLIETMQLLDIIQNENQIYFTIKSTYIPTQHWNVMISHKKDFISTDDILSIAICKSILQFLEWKENRKLY